MSERPRIAGGDAKAGDHHALAAELEDGSPPRDDSFLCLRALARDTHPRRSARRWPCSGARAYQLAKAGNRLVDLSVECSFEDARPKAAAVDERDPDTAHIGPR